MATITGTFPVKVVDNATSYYVPGYLWMPAYQNRRWDGKIHIFNAKTNKFPAGLTHLIVEALKQEDSTAVVDIVDTTVYPKIAGNGFDLHGIEFGEGKYDYQQFTADAMCSKPRGIIKLSTNSGKSAIFAAITKHYAVPTLFMISRLGLIYQTREVFSKYLRIPQEDIGVVGDGEFSIGKWITMATPTSLKNKIHELDPSYWQMLLLDECHEAASDTSFDVLNQLTAPYRYGGSGTPLDRTDGADLKLISQTGPILYEVSNKLLVDRGISVPPVVEMIKIDQPIIDGMVKYKYSQVEKLGIIENRQLNQIVVDKTIEHVDNGKQVLILVDKVAHGTKLLNSLKDSIACKFLSGKESAQSRADVLQEFKEGVVRAIVATSVLDVGIDVPNIDVLILAAGGKSKIRLLQRVGRGLRSGKDKDRLLVIDFMYVTHKYLTKHSLQRLKTYKEQECFTITVGNVNKDVTTED